MAQLIGEHLHDSHKFILIIEEFTLLSGSPVSELTRVFIMVELTVLISVKLI